MCLSPFACPYFFHCMSLGEAWTVSSLIDQKQRKMIKRKRRWKILSLAIFGHQMQDIWARKEIFPLDVARMRYADDHKSSAVSTYAVHNVSIYSVGLDTSVRVQHELFNAGGGAEGRRKGQTLSLQTGSDSLRELRSSKKYDERLWDGRVMQLPKEWIRVCEGSRFRTGMRNIAHLG